MTTAARKTITKGGCTSLTALILNRAVPELPKGTARVIDADMRFRLQCQAVAGNGHLENARRNAAIRALNIERVYEAIKAGACHYADMVSATGISKSTVQRICHELHDISPQRIKRHGGARNSVTYTIMEATQ